MRIALEDQWELLVAQMSEPRVLVGRHISTERLEWRQRPRTLSAVEPHPIEERGQPCIDREA